MAQKSRIEGLVSDWIDARTGYGERLIRLAESPSGAERKHHAAAALASEQSALRIAQLIVEDPQSSRLQPKTLAMFKEEAAKAGLPRRKAKSPIQIILKRFNDWENCPQRVSPEERMREIGGNGYSIVALYRRPNMLAHFTPEF